MGHEFCMQSLATSIKPYFQNFVSHFNCSTLISFKLSFMDSRLETRIKIVSAANYFLKIFME